MPEGQRTRSVRKVLGAENSQTRVALIDAAEQLLREEGYAAVTSRRIAARAGLKHQVIYYYFDTLDDLLLEVYRRGAEKGLERLDEALDSDEPLRSLWEFICDPRGTRFITEFMALSMRNEVLRAEMARHGELTRKRQAEVVARHLQTRGLEPLISPLLVTLLMNALARLLVSESTMGLSLGHGEARGLVEACLGELEMVGGAAGAAHDFLSLSTRRTPAADDAA